MPAHKAKYKTKKSKDVKWKREREKKRCKQRRKNRLNGGWLSPARPTDCTDRTGRAADRRKTTSVYQCRWIEEEGAELWSVPVFLFYFAFTFSPTFQKKKKRTTTVQFNSHPQPVITHIRRLSDSNRIVRELGDFLTRLFSCNRFRFVIILNIFTRQSQSYPQKML